MDINPARNTSSGLPGVHVSHSARGPLTQSPQLAATTGPVYNAPNIPLLQLRIEQFLDAAEEVVKKLALLAAAERELGGSSAQVAPPHKEVFSRGTLSSTEISAWVDVAVLLVLVAISAWYASHTSKQAKASKDIVQEMYESGMGIVQPVMLLNLRGQKGDILGEAEGEFLLLHPLPNFRREPDIATIQSH